MLLLLMMETMMALKKFCFKKAKEKKTKILKKDMTLESQLSPPTVVLTSRLPLLPPYFFFLPFLIIPDPFFLPQKVQPLQILLTHIQKTLLSH